MGCRSMGAPLLRLEVWHARPTFNRGSNSSAAAVPRPHARLRAARLDGRASGRKPDSTPVRRPCAALWAVSGLWDCLPRSDSLSVLERRWRLWKSPPWGTAGSPQAGLEIPAPSGPLGNLRIALPPGRRPGCFGARQERSATRSSISRYISGRNPVLGLRLASNGRLLRSGILRQRKAPARSGNLRGFG
jgi:hypothetical protein